MDRLNIKTQFGRASSDGIWNCLSNRDGLLERPQFIGTDKTILDDLMDLKMRLPVKHASLYEELGEKVRI